MVFLRITIHYRIKIMKIESVNYNFEEYISLLANRDGRKGMNIY